MKHIEKKRLTPKQLTAIILVSVFAVLLAGAITLGVIYSKRGEEETPKKVPEILDGEALLYNNPVAYPTMEKGDITFIEISGGGNTYGLFRSGSSTALELFYKDSSGNMNVYYPNISLEDPYFSYDSLYAIEKDDGFGTMPKLTYLCTALQMAYFDERIPLSADPDEREAQLKVYGFEGGKTTTVIFTYNSAVKDENGNAVKDENGNTVTEQKAHRIVIGKKNITDSGYYFQVDGREYVYASRTAYYDYAISGFFDLINPTLVGAGISSDGAYAPYITQGYYQWKTEQHKEAGDTVVSDSDVIVFTDKLTPPGESDEPASDGFVHTGYSQIEIKLSEYKDKAAYRNMLRALIGAEIGTYGDEGGVGNIIFSTVSPYSNKKLLNLENESGTAYTYTIDKILSVITENGEKIDTGYHVGTNTVIKVAYSAASGGKTYTSFAVLDLSSPNIPEGVKNTLASSSVGALDVPQTFTVNYTKENAPSASGKYVITEILAIFDKDGNEINTVTSDSVVSYRYSYELNGEVVYEDSFALNMANPKDESDKKLASLLLGKTVKAGYEITLNEYTSYYEIMQDFVEYRVARIDYFVTKKLVAAFKFQNSSQWDPYYGESFYENLLENEYSLYGIDFSTCENIVRFLGGVSDDGESNKAVGLSGDEVVALGLTPENMEKFGLYKNAVRFMLPQGLIGYAPDDTEDDNALEDWTYINLLTFNLYISDPDPVDGTRYVGSDMYDIVVKVDGENYFFLDEDFASFWARRKLLLVESDKIESIKIDLGYDDMYGKYLFELSHRDVTYQNGSQTATETVLSVKVTPEGSCTPNKLTEFISANGYSYVSLEEFFNSLYPNDPENKDCYPESLGSSYFRELLLMLYCIDYEGMLTEEEQTAARDLNKRLLRMELKMTSSQNSYVFEFYAIDSVRTMVSIHRENPNGDVTLGPVSDFYISNFAFRKIVKNGFFDLLNGVKIDGDTAYGD